VNGSCPITVYYRQEKNPRIHDALTQLGFDIVELEPHKETIIAEGIAGTIFPTDYDSALVIRAGTRLILNLNDCTLSQAEIDSLKRMSLASMRCFISFSPGGYNPNQLQLARESFLRKVDRLFIAVRPALFVPFASSSISPRGECLPERLDYYPRRFRCRTASSAHTDSLHRRCSLMAAMDGTNDLNLVRWREAMHAPKKDQATCIC